MPPHTWRKRSSFTIDGYMWIVLNRANIPKRHSGYIPLMSPTYMAPEHEKGRLESLLLRIVPKQLTP